MQFPHSLTHVLASCKIELFVATFCNHVSSWLKIHVPSRCMLPTCTSLLPSICPAQQVEMLNVLFVCPMVVHVIYLDYYTFIKKLTKSKCIIYLMIVF